MKAPIRARAPPMVHAPSAIAGVGTSRATTAGFLNMPAPIMPPMTMRVASKGPSLGATQFSAGADWEGSMFSEGTPELNQIVAGRKQQTVAGLAKNDVEFEERAARLQIVAS